MKGNIIVVCLILITLTVFVISLTYNSKIRKQEATAFEQYLSSEPIDTVWWGSNKEQIPYYTDSGRFIWYGYDLMSIQAFI